MSLCGGGLEASLDTLARTILGRRQILGKRQTCTEVGVLATGLMTQDHRALRKDSSKLPRSSRRVRLHVQMFSVEVKTGKFVVRLLFTPINKGFASKEAVVELDAETDSLSAVGGQLQKLRPTHMTLSSG